MAYTIGAGHVISAYEARIQSLENEKLVIREKIAMSVKPRAPFETTFRTAMDFLSKPVKLWLSGDPKQQKTVLKLTFAKQLSYKKHEGFRTAQPSLPFQVIQGLKGSREESFSLENTMAHPKGFEPLTP